MAGQSRQNAEEENDGAWREAPAAGSTPNAQRPTFKVSNAPASDSSPGRWALEVGRWALNVPRHHPRMFLMRLPWHGWAHFTLRAIRVIRVIRGQLFPESSWRSNSQRSAFLCGFAALRDENPRPARIGTRHFPSRGKMRRVAETAHSLRRGGQHNFASKRKT